MIRYSMAAAGCLAALTFAPAQAQSVQDAQRQLFVCMQKANNMGLKDQERENFIKKCAEEPGKPVDMGRQPT